jgi:hypothetical protein
MDLFWTESESAIRYFIVTNSLRPVFHFVVEKSTKKKMSAACVLVWYRVASFLKNGPVQV